MTMIYDAGQESFETGQQRDQGLGYFSTDQDDVI